MTDIILNSEDDLMIANGDFVIGDSLTQEVSLIIATNQGEWKNDPIIGATLMPLMKSNANANVIQQRVKLHFHRDGKNYDDVKNRIQFNTSE